MSGREVFDWGADNGNVVLRAYGSIAGDVVIRQERDAFEEDDHWVVVPVQDAELVAQAIIQKAAEIKRGDPPAEPEERDAKATPLALPPPTRPGELRLEGGTRVVRKSGGAS